MFKISNAISQQQQKYCLLRKGPLMLDLINRYVCVCVCGVCVYV